MLPEGSSLSNWEKPGGKTGMVVLGLLGAGGLMLFYKALPFLITLASNTLYLGLLLGLIAGIIYLLCNPCKVQAVIDVNFDGRRTDAIRQTAAFANYVKQVMSETHE